LEVDIYLHQLSGFGRVPWRSIAFRIAHADKAFLNAPPPKQDVSRLKMALRVPPFWRKMNYLHAGVENRHHLRWTLMKVAVRRDNGFPAIPCEYRDPVLVCVAALISVINVGKFESLA
jgi:hypothetical protein